MFRSRSDTQSLRAVDPLDQKKSYPYLSVTPSLGEWADPEVSSDSLLNSSGGETLRILLDDGVKGLMMDPIGSFECFHGVL